MVKCYICHKNEGTEININIPKKPKWACKRCVSDTESWLEVPKDLSNGKVKP